MIKKYSELSNTINNFKNFKDSNDPAYITHYFQNNNFEFKNLLAKKYKEDLLSKLFPNYKNFEIIWDIPFVPSKKGNFTFIDLFAGIGGFRIAFQDLGGKCVFGCEWDINAKKTYEKNFGEIPFGNIKEINEKDIPNHDILLAGFPCQAFSIAGRKGGFGDIRGTLFFDLARIIKEKQPKAFFLENVKGLLSHDKRRTIKTILTILREDLKYFVPNPEIINAKYFGVPQNRERIFIVGFRSDLNINTFTYPKPGKADKTIKDILEEKTVSSKYYLSLQYLQTLRNHKIRHESKGNGFGFEIIGIEGIANAIVVGGMGRERNLVIDNRLKDYKPVTNIKSQINKEGIRRMTPREWARLQGFPDKFIIPVSDTQAYKQFGNSVAIPAIKATGANIINILFKE